jgi:hypothetical protein
LTYPPPKASHAYAPTVRAATTRFISATAFGASGTKLMTSHGSDVEFVIRERQGLRIAYEERCAFYRAVTSAAI